MILKIDLEKAFDRIEYGFIRQALHLFNFPTGRTNRILSCIFTFSIFILLNGSRTTFSIHLEELDKVTPYHLTSLFFA